MKPASAKWRREERPNRNLNGNSLRPLGKYRQAKTLQEYYDQRVIKYSEDDCWMFTTSGDKNGYPQVIGSKHCAQLGLTRAHQVAYVLYKGQIPKGLIVCHHCDNPFCVNPNHLFVGTINDNNQDMVSKGRNLGGINYVAK